MKRIFTMKHTLTLLFSLLLVPFIANAASPTDNSRIVVASQAGAKLDSDVTKGGFYTDPIAYPLGRQLSARFEICTGALININNN